MDYSKYEKMIASNEKEIEVIKKDSNLTKEEKDERITFLENQNQNLNNYLTRVKGIDKNIENIKKKDSLTKEDKKNIDDLKRDKREAKIELNKSFKGRFRDVVSSLVGQVDKRVNNFVFGKDNKVSKKLYEWKCKLINLRYKYKGRYFLSELGLKSLALIGLSFAAINPVVFSGLVIAFGAGTIARAVTTVYNQIKYGGPVHQRRYNIQKGGYLKNIKSSIFKFRKSKDLSKISEDEMVKNTSHESEEKDESKIDEKTKKDEKEDDFTKIYIDNVRNQINNSFNNIDTLTREQLERVIRLGAAVYTSLSDEDKAKLRALDGKYSKLNSVTKKEEPKVDAIPKDMHTPTNEDLAVKNPISTKEDSVVKESAPAKEDSVVKKSVENDDIKVLRHKNKDLKTDNDIISKDTTAESLTYGQKYVEAMRDAISTHTDAETKMAAREYIKSVEKGKRRQLVQDLKYFRVMIDDIYEKFHNAKTDEERSIYRHQLKDAINYCNEEAKKYGIILDKEYDRRNKNRSIVDEEEKGKTR